MKINSSTVLFAISFFAMTVHADYKNPSADIKARLSKVALAHVAVQALLKSSASEVMMTTNKCQLELKSIVGEADSFNQNKTVSGALEIQQICDNTEAGAATNTKIQASIGSDKMMIDTVQIGRSGF
jgi:hypothetical protein